MECNINLENFNLLNRSLFIHNEIDNTTADTFNKDVNKLILEDNIIFNNNLENIKQLFNNVDFTDVLNINNRNVFPEVNIYLNTPGGICYLGLSICDSIKQLNKHCKVNIIATGHCMSMGIPILLSVPLEQRKCTENTSFMIHQVTSFLYDKVAGLEENLKESKRLNEIMFNMILENTNITEKQLKENYNKKSDWFITAQEALKLKLVSEII